MSMNLQSRYYAMTYRFSTTAHSGDDLMYKLQFPFSDIHDTVFKSAIERWYCMLARC